MQERYAFVEENNKQDWSGNMKKRMSLHDKAEVALKKAVKKVVERHKKNGRLISVWQDGKVRKIAA